MINNEAWMFLVVILCLAGQQYEARLNKTLLPTITVDDINARAAKLTHQHSAVYKTVEHK